VIYSDKPVAGAKSVQELEVVPAPAAEELDAAGTRRQRDLEQAHQVDARMREKDARRVAAQKEVEKARQLLADAERAAELGRTPLPGEMVSNVGGGVRPSQDYLDRQKALEDQVMVARERLEIMQRSLADTR
jgi:hypothetical protein